MSLSNLLQYESDDDENDSRQTANTVALPVTAAPTAIHPISHSVQPIAPIEQLEKRALSDDEHQVDNKIIKKRQRTEPQLSSSASSPSAYVPPPASFFSFASPASSSVPAAPTDLLSMLPAPKNTRTRDTTTQQQPLRTDAGDASAPFAAPAVAASSPIRRPSSPPPTTANPAISASTSTTAASQVPAVATEPTVAPPPGVRRKVEPPISTLLPQPFASSAHSNPFSAPRIAYSTASPYAVQSTPPPSTTPASTAPTLYTSYEEPRMQRQWLEAANIVDVRVDDITQHYTPTPPTHKPLSISAAAPGDLKVKTTYWDARQGKEVEVWGVQGRQQRAHQINSLAIEAKKFESDIMRAKEHRSQIRQNVRSKYGW